jgi:amino acid transporter
VSIDARLLTGFLLYVLFPLWLIAGVADYLCHRRTAIEDTSGARENALHVVQALEIGGALLAALFLEINALVMALIVMLVIAHTLTAYCDVAYAAPRRFISPFEQHVHSYLEIIPIAAAGIVAILHWDAMTPVSFGLGLKDPPLPAAPVIVVLALIAVLQAIPLAEESLRTARRGRKRAG